MGLVAGAVAPATRGAQAGLPAPEDPDQVEIHPFSIPDTQNARALRLRIEEHLYARRWSDAIADLQAILEDHQGDVLGASRPRRGGLVSQRPVHPGAVEWAHRRLAELPSEARALYRERYETQARTALAAARATGRRQNLAAVGARWPISASAERAWWALGDLELELGNVREATWAWERALAVRTSAVGLELVDGAAWEAAREVLAGDDAGVRARVDVALRALADPTAFAAGDRPAQLRSPGPGDATGTPPGARADGWTQPWELPDDHPFARHPGALLLPVLQGDALYVSTSLQVARVNAFTGRQEWITPEPPGWSSVSSTRRKEFFESVEEDACLVAPAAANGVVVAALQIPITHVQGQTFRQIQITRVIPDRRLFAFDAETGAPLWDHMPDLSWDGESGSFEDRMSVAGPPVVAGTRLLVPFYRMRGRIDYHVGCFDLATGERLWSTDVISGQRELNMFGRHETEFCAPPLAVVDDRVVAQTQLGSLAALDLFTGEILWECLYDQIELPKNRQWEATPRPVFWRSAPPVVVDELVVATPLDSEDLLGVDLATGAVLWSLPNRGINRLVESRGRTAVNLLVGADERRVYLGGSAICALAAPAGLANGAPVQPEWVFEESELASMQSPPRPALGAAALVVVTDDRRCDLDRHTGRYLGFPTELTVRGTSGHVLLGDGLFFTLNTRRLSGWFEWDVLLGRARERLAESPADRRAALELGRLLGQRGRSEGERGFTSEAIAHLVEAREVLEPLVTGSDDVDPALAAELHHGLRAEARARADLAQTPAAIDLLRRARELAPDREALLWTLLQEEALHDRTSDRDAAALLALYDELERSCAEETIACVRDAPPGAPHRRPASDAGERAALRPVDPREVPAGKPFTTVPAGLWVCLERAALAGRRGDFRRELEDLHRVLYAWPDVRLFDATAYDLAAERIARRRAASGPEPFAPFEERAEALLEDALAERDRERLAEVPRSFPQTAAARRANDALLDWAVEEADVAAIAGIVRGELGEGWTPRGSTEREARLLLRLAGAARRQGNAALWSGIVRVLAPWHGELVPTGGDRPLAALAAELGTGTGPGSEAREPRTFTDRVLLAGELPGRFDALGEVLPPRGGSPDAARVLLFVEDDTVAAFGPRAPTAPAWTFRMPERSAPSYWTDRFAATGGLPILAGRDRVIALERETGELRWEHVLAHGEVEAVCADDGVAVASTATRDGGHELVALEVRSGTVLWRAPVDGARYDTLPITGSGRLVLLPYFGEQTIAVRDLFTGQATLEIPYPWLPQRSIHDGSWIQDDLLVVPRFRESEEPEKNHVLAYDLATGREAWRLSLEDEAGRWLDAVVHHGGDTYLLLRPGPRASGADLPGYLVQLQASIGAKRRVGRVELAREDRLLGVLPKRRTTLTEPWLFQRQATDGGETLIRAIHLPHGERWVWRLPVGHDALFPINRPGLSDATVALAYTRTTERRGISDRATLVFLDRASGRLADSRILNPDLNVSDNVYLFPLGDALLVKGKLRLEIHTEQAR